MNRKIGMVSLIGLVLAGLIGFYIGRHSEQKSTFESVVDSPVSPNLNATILPKPTASVSPASPQPATPIPTESPVVQSASQGFFNLKSDIHAEGSQGPFYFLATADHRYEVIAAKDDKVQINFNGLKGWIPEWYLLKDSNETQVIDVTPYIMLVNKATNVLLYPLEDAPDGFMFEEGKVVRVYKEYGKWVAVNFINYAEPNRGDFWILKQDLIAWDPKKAKEGRLKAGIGKKYADMQESTHVKIVNEGNQTYQVNSYGGVTGEIDKADFVPNPFIDRPIAPKSPLTLIDNLELTADQAQIYDSYAKKRLDDQLKGLGAGDVFKFYLEAIFNKDQETMYALYRKGEGYEIPSLDTFLEDLKSDSANAEKLITAWNELKQKNTFVVQENYLEDKHAAVYIIPLDKAAEIKSFQLYETKAGIWKVAWMPLQ